MPTNPQANPPLGRTLSLDGEPPDAMRHFVTRHSRPTPFGDLGHDCRGHNGDRLRCCRTRFGRHAEDRRFRTFGPLRGPGQPKGQCPPAGSRCTTSSLAPLLRPQLVLRNTGGHEEAAAVRPAIGLHATSKRAHDGPPNPDVDRPMTNIVAELRVRMDPIAVAFRGIEGALMHYHQFEDWNSRTARQFAALHPRQRVRAIDASHPTWSGVFPGRDGGKGLLSDGHGPQARRGRAIFRNDPGGRPGCQQSRRQR